MSRSVWFASVDSRPWSSESFWASFFRRCSFMFTFIFERFIHTGKPAECFIWNRVFRLGILEMPLRELRPGKPWRSCTTKLEVSQRLRFLFSRSARGALTNLFLLGQEFFGFWLFHRPAIMIRDPDLVKQILVKDFSHFHDRAVHLDKDADALSAHLFALKGTEWKRLR